MHYDEDIPLRTHRVTVTSDVQRGQQALQLITICAVYLSRDYINGSVTTPGIAKNVYACSKIHMAKCKGVIYVITYA